MSLCGYCSCSLTMLDDTSEEDMCLCKRWLYFSTLSVCVCVYVYVLWIIVKWLHDEIHLIEDTFSIKTLTHRLHEAFCCCCYSFSMMMSYCTGRSHRVGMKLVSWKPNIPVDEILPLHSRATGTWETKITFACRPMCFVSARSTYRLFVDSALYLFSKCWCLYPIRQPFAIDDGVQEDSSSSGCSHDQQPMSPQPHQEPQTE